MLAYDTWGRANIGEGRGSLEPDLIKSYLWFKAAAAPDQYQKKFLGESSRGHIGKTKRFMKYYQIQITPSQIAEAERLATDWVPNAEDCYVPDEAQAAN